MMITTIHAYLLAQTFKPNCHHITIGHIATDEMEFKFIVNSWIFFFSCIKLVSCPNITPNEVAFGDHIEAIKATRPYLMLHIETFNIQNVASVSMYLVFNGNP